MKKLILSGVATLAICSTAIGAPSPTTSTPMKPVARPVDSAASAAAKAELVKMSETLKDAKGISYSSTLYYAVPGPTGPVTKTTTTKVIVERPSKFSLKTSSGGKLLTELSSSGDKFIVYDVAAGTYAQESSTPDLKSALTALGDTGRTVFQQPDAGGESLRAALGFPISFLNGQFFIESAPAQATISFDSVPETVDGTVIHSITETLDTAQGDIELTFGVNPTTHLPVMQIVKEFPPSSSQPPVTILKEMFSNFKVLSAAAAPSVYALTPPATASSLPIVPLPVEPTAPMAPAPDGAAPAPAPPADGGTAPAQPAPAAPAPVVPAPTAPVGQAAPPAPPL